jgi:hypothetical protein
MLVANGFGEPDKIAVEAAVAVSGGAPESDVAAAIASVIAQAFSLDEAKVDVCTMRASASGVSRIDASISIRGWGDADASDAAEHVAAFFGETSSLGFVARLKSQFPTLANAASVVVTAPATGIVVDAEYNADRDTPSPWSGRSGLSTPRNSERATPLSSARPPPLSAASGDDASDVVALAKALTALSAKVDGFDQNLSAITAMVERVERMLAEQQQRAAPTTPGRKSAAPEITTRVV